MAGAHDGAAPEAPVAQKAGSASGMVSAVSGGRGAPQVDLKFTLRSRPTPGEPVEIDVALIPTAPSDSLRLIFQNADGIEFRAGQDMPSVSNATPGVVLAHRVTVVPHDDGIYALTAVALFDSPTVSVTRTFVIPLIVGQGLATPDS